MITDKFNGFIMSKDKIVAKINDGTVINYDEKLAPLYIKRKKDFEGWLKHRSIDLHRTNSRLLRKVLRLNTSDEIKIVLSVNGATITDTYWVKEINSNLEYKDIVFKSDNLSDLALFGDPNAFSSNSDRTPELTNIGSYEKCWKLHDKQWYMYKQGTGNEKFSEMFTFRLGAKLNFNMAEYELKHNYIRTKDFTENGKLIFEPMYSLLDDDEDYLTNINILKGLKGNLVKEYLDIIFLDTLVMNVDRHTFNYGILRDVDSGEILRMAPNFDNNLSLISRGYVKNTERNDLLVKLFLEVLDEVNYDIPYVSEEAVKEIIDITNNEFEKDFDKEYIMKFIMNAYKKIADEINL